MVCCGPTYSEGLVLLLRNLKIWDGVSDEISSDYDAVLISQGRIKKLTSADEKVAGVPTRDYEG